MNKLRLRIARIALALGVAALAWACNAPFIPIPPPGASFSSQLVSDGQGGQKTVWIAHGGPYEPASLARIFVFDTDRSAGVIAQAAADGSYTSPSMDGVALDRIEISYETPAFEVSARVCFQLVEAPSAPRCPSP